MPAPEPRFQQGEEAVRIVSADRAHDGVDRSILESGGEVAGPGFGVGPQLEGVHPGGGILPHLHTELTFEQADAVLVDGRERGRAPP